ncbi:MAG: hypothetical protein N3A01_08370, partial [Bacteroidales bacterium]|nr:hypothetical protein [Bacteroidales bacterium]
MKKVLVLIFIFINFINAFLAFSQCTNCNSNYPSGTFSISPGQTNTVTTCAWGGDYAYYSVVAGNTYTWSTCGDSDFDTQLTLFQGTCGGTVLAYNDDASGCGLQSTITWTATFTGTVVVLVSRYNCQTYTSACMTVIWSCSSSGGGGGGGSQNCNNDYCSTACPFCTGTTYSFPMNTGITAPSGPNYGCLCTQPNPVWYYMLIDQPGNMTIYIQSPTGNDVDFVAWGPFSSLNNICYSQLTGNCSGCLSGCPNNTSNPNFYPSGQMVDCSYDPASYEYLHINNAQTGQYYLLCITNYSNQPGTLTFTKSGGNATTNCNIVTCNMQNLTATPSACNPSNNYYSVSGSITFSGAPTTGQLIVTDNSGVSQTFNPPFNSPINYTLSNLNSNGVPHTITAYFTAAPTCSLTINYTAPAACNTCNANAGPDQTVCGLVTSLNASYGSNTQSYQWSPMSGISFGNIGSPTTSITATAPGSYTLTWNVTTTSGVTCSDQVIINFVNPTAGFTYNNNQCLQGNSFNFTNTGTSSGATYYWTFQNGTPSSSTAQNPTGITWSAAGSYQVTQTVTQGSCTATYTQTITVYPNPTVTINSTNTTCYGQCNGSATASASGGSSFTYNWSNGSTSQTINGLCAGIYTVTVTNSYGCTNTQSVTITQPSPLNLITTRTNPTCAGLCNGTASVTVSGGIGPFSYLWSNGSTTQNISGLCAGTYTVTVTDNASTGCTSSASVSLTNPPSMTLSISSVNATCGINNGSATVTITSGGSPNFSYSWSNGSSTNNTPSTTNTISNIGAGTYTVTVTDATGCTKTAVVNVNSSGAPTATITNSIQPTCYGQCNGSVTVSLGGTLNPPFNYQWSTGSSTTGTTSTTNTINNACAGTVTVTITDNLGCSATANVSLSQPPQLNATTSTVSAHCNQNDGSATVTPTGGTPGYSYQWNSAAGNQTTQTANNLFPGTYTVTVTDANGCTKTATATVGNLAGVTASISSITNVSCYGGSNGTATASGTGGTPPYTFQWPPLAGNQTTPTAINLQAGTYIVTVTDYYNCTSTATAVINQPPQLVASIISSTNVTCYSLCNGTATVG